MLGGSQATGTGLAADLAALPGARSRVVLGGSRATGTQRSGSDWDLGLYYPPLARTG